MWCTAKVERLQLLLKISKLGGGSELSVVDTYMFGLCSFHWIKFNVLLNSIV
jgi:hypothetical protein